MPVSYTHLLYRVNDNQPCVVFPDCPCYAFIGKGQRRIPVINDKHFFEVCVRFYQSRLDGITQTVLGGLIDDVERLKGLDVYKRQAIPCVQLEMGGGKFHAVGAEPVFEMLTAFGVFMDVEPVSYTHLQTTLRMDAKLPLQCFCQTFA